MVPTSYQEWRHCIEVHCGLELTPDFMRRRLQELDNPTDFRTEQFIRLYGESHRRQVVDWFQQALKRAQ